MALPRLPSLDQILDDPSIILSLPIPLLVELKDRLLHVDRIVSGTSNLPLTPIDMAIRNARFKWMDTPHLHFIGQEVAAAVSDLKALIVSVPPQHGKSWTCSVWTPFWALARNPETNVLLISYEKTVARRWGARVRDLIISYGEQYGLQLDPKKTAADDWELTTGGGMVCVGVGGPISGRTVNLMLVDDPLKDQEAARSATQRQTLWEWWDETASQRIQPDTAVITIGTRWHEDDLIGRMLKASDAGTGTRFTNVVLRAKAEVDDPLGRQPGEGLWIAGEKCKGQEFYEEKEKKISAYAWQGGHQQRPSPPGGNMVDPDWWRFYRPSELPSVFDQGVQSWDLALDSVKMSDSYMAGLVAGRKGALVFVRDSFHEHCDINKVVEEILRWNRLYPWAKQKLVERAISGNALVQMLRSKCSGMLAWPPKGQQKGSKEANLDACVPDIRSGNVLLPLLPDGTKPKWVDEFIEEMRQFPRSAHDDWVDSFTQGVGFLLPSARQSVNRDHSLALTKPTPDTLVEAHNQRLHEVMRKAGKIQAGGGRGEVVQFSSLSSLSSQVDRVFRKAGGAGRGMW